MATYNIWETIDSNPGGVSDRLPVPQGWIVRSWTYHGVHQVFVPDPNHTWKLAEQNPRQQKPVGDGSTAGTPLGTCLTPDVCKGHCIGHGDF